MTSELTLLVLRLAFLAVLWMFAFSIIYALRSDLFGTRSSEYAKSLQQQRQQTFGAAPDDGHPVVVAAPAPVSAAPVPQPVAGGFAGAAT